MRYSLPILIVILLASLLWWKWPHIRAYYAPPPRTDIVDTGSGSTEYRRAYFAAGCFWCAESSYESYA